MTFEQFSKIISLLAAFASAASLLIGCYSANKKNYSEGAYWVSLAVYLSFSSWKLLQ